jgi:prepilin-type N-terminal cleavage/methylation domain-containing protein/prepilin-type processing-associated H-X9-DG protein
MLQSPRHVYQRLYAFTLIELLVVISIIGVLTALILSAVQSARQSALRAECGNRLRQIGLALHQYHNAHGLVPPGVCDGTTNDPYPFLSWHARLLPYLEQGALWEQTTAAFAQTRQFLEAPPHPLAHPLPVFGCPLDVRITGVGLLETNHPALTSFMGVAGTDYNTLDGMLFLHSRLRWDDVTDGLSTTLLVGERPASADQRFGWWYGGWGQSQDGSGDMVLGVRERNTGGYMPYCKPGPFHFRAGRIDKDCHTFHFWSLHAGGAHFLFADGSITFLAYSADTLLPALATRAGNESTASP